MSNVDAAASSTSKSAVSRKFVRATETALTQLLSADLSELDPGARRGDWIRVLDGA